MFIIKGHNTYNRITETKGLECLHSGFIEEVRAGTETQALPTLVLLFQKEGQIVAPSLEGGLQWGPSCPLPPALLQQLSGAPRVQLWDAQLRLAARNPHALLANQLSGTGRDSWQKWTLCQKKAAPWQELEKATRCQVHGSYQHGAPAAGRLFVGLLKPHSSELRTHLQLRGEAVPAAGSLALYPGETSRGSETAGHNARPSPPPPLCHGGAGWGAGGPAGGAAAIGGHWLDSSRRSAPHGAGAASSSSRCGEWRRRRGGVSPRSSFGRPAASSARRRRGRPGSSWWRAWASASTGCTTRWAGSAAPRGRALRAGVAVRPSSAAAAPARFLPALRKRLAA